MRQRSHQDTRLEEPLAADPAVLSCEKNVDVRPVYNLTVHQNHLYYAGGFLVHNCDSSSQALSYLLYSNGTTGVIADAKQLRLEESLEQEKEAFLSEGIYDVYGQNSDIY